MTELERQKRLAAITRSNNAYTGAANPTLANVGQQAVNAGTTSGMVSGYVDAAKAQSERENAEAMARSFKGQESNIASQRARAASLRGKGMPQARMVGEGRWATLTQPNWGEQLEGVTNQLVGGYLEGQARKDAEQLDVDVTEQTGLVLATEAAEKEAVLALDAERYGIEQGNINRTFDQTAEQNLLTNAIAVQRNRLTESGQQDDRDKGEGISVQDVNNKNNIMRAVVGPQGKLYSITDAGTRGDLLPSNWIQLETTTTGGTNLAIGEQQKQQGRVTLQEMRTTGSMELAELRAKLKEEGLVDQENRERIRQLADAEAELNAEMGTAAISTENAITVWNNALLQPNLYSAMGLGGNSIATGVSGFDVFEEGIKNTQRAISRAGSEGAAKDFERLELKPVSDTEFAYVVEDLNPTWKDSPSGLIQAAMEYVPAYRGGLEKAEKSGAIAKGTKDIVMNQMLDSIVIASTSENPDTGKMTMSIRALRDKGIDVNDTYTRLTKKLENETITQREEDALFVLDSLIGS